jgi:biopolymer transport protein ExbB/TolQ
MVIEGICEALLTTVLGLRVAVPAVCFYNYLSNEMEVFDIEIEVTSLELVAYFALRLGRQEKSRFS